MHQLIAFYRRTDKIQFNCIFLSIVLMFVIINAYAFNYPNLPSQIPLFYSLPWGDSQLAALPQFTILPFIILLAALINTFLSWQLHESQIALKRLLCGSVLVIALLVTITALKIMFIFI